MTRLERIKDPGEAWSTRPETGGTGSTPTLADVLAEGADANGVGITNLPDGVNPQDAATVAQIGGSQPGVPRIIGPYAVDFTDIEEPGDVLNIVQLPVGTLVLDWMPNVETSLVFETTGGGPTASIVAMGQGAAFDRVPPADDRNGQWGYIDWLSGSDNAASDLWNNVVSSDHVNFSGVEISVAKLVKTEDATPVRAVNVSGDTYVAGHTDLYFLIATPPFDSDAVITG